MLAIESDHCAKPVKDGGNKILALVLVSVDFLPQTLNGVLQLHLALGLLGLHPVLHYAPNILNGPDVGHFWFLFVIRNPT